MPSGIFRPLGLDSASPKTRESCALPSHPAKTYINFKSKVIAAKIFYVVPSFLPRNFPGISTGTFAGTWVLSIAPTQSYINMKEKNYNFFF